MKAILFGIALFISTASFAQGNIADTVSVKTVHGTVLKLLSILSDNGKPTDWEAFRNLFLPTADLTAVTHDKSGKRPLFSFTVEEFIKRMHDVYFGNQFLEKEIGVHIDEYNGIANVFQTYHGKDNKQFEETGVNSYQLVFDNNRWWITNLVWSDESNGIKVPNEFLNKM